MVNIKNKRCIECKCKNPYFGYETDNVATYCKTCKKDGISVFF